MQNTVDQHTRRLSPPPPPPSPSPSLSHHSSRSPTTPHPLPPPAANPQWKRTHPPPSESGAALTRDFLALSITGAYFYYVWQLGGPGSEALPELLRPYAWVLEQQAGLQKAVSLALLVLVFLLVAVLRRA